MNKNKKMKSKIIIIGVVLFLVGCLYQQNNGIVTTSIKIESTDIPNHFDGYKICQISDLHSKSFGLKQRRLVNKIVENNPDVIVVTGDTVDARRYNEESCLELFSQITDIAPVYFVTGNHEAKSHKFEEFEKRLKAADVIVLRNDSQTINIDEDEILIIGLDDPSFYLMNINTTLEKLTEHTDSTFSILLSHRPELMDVYAEQNVNLIFSGHAHGGQVRLPLVGGLIAPNQGFFPQYTSGLYKKDNSLMVVSRGLGNSLAPQRIFNRPEIVLTTLRKNSTH
jgi:predicted MPP superfamily phosphohydrolase